jgi:glycosyltransferase involved in cell wall biosynthesis
MDLSIVIPVFNEEESIAPLFNAIIRAVGPLHLDYEIILVDDGSTDRTFDRAVRIAKQNPEFKIIQLNRNYGQSTALDAGFQNAKGKFIVTMDGDLQNDPADIQRLLNKINEGYDIVFGWRKKRKDHWLLRKLPSKLANALIRIVTATDIKDIGCAMRICRSEINKQFNIYSDMHRYLPVIAVLAGAKMAQIEVKHHPRKLGKSKYNLTRIYKVLIDLVAIKTIWTGLYRPLFGFGMGAIFFALISLFFFLVSFVIVFRDPGGSIVIPLGVSMLLGALSLFLLAVGFISDIAYHASNQKTCSILKNTRGVSINHNESETFDQQ